MTDTPVKLMTVAQAAVYLGKSLTTVYRWLEDPDHPLKAYPGMTGQMVVLEAAAVEALKGRQDGRRRKPEEVS